MPTGYGIDVHKKMLRVVSNVEVESEFQFERRMFGSNPEQLRSLPLAARARKSRKWSWNNGQFGNQCGERLERY